MRASTSIVSAYVSERDRETACWEREREREREREVCIKRRENQLVASIRFRRSFKKARHHPTTTKKEEKKERKKKVVVRLKSSFRRSNSINERRSRRRRSSVGKIKHLRETKSDRSDFFRAFLIWQFFFLSFRVWYHIFISSCVSLVSLF